MVSGMAAFCGAAAELPSAHAEGPETGLDRARRRATVAAMSLPPQPPSYYAATAIPSPERPSLAGQIDCDVCVIGGGYTGLSSALHLAERGYDVVLLEAARIGWGASGRNGGQIGSGQRLGALELIEAYGHEDAIRLWALAEEAKAAVRERIARHAIACDYRPGILAAAIKPDHFAWIEKTAACLEEVYDYHHVEVIAPGDMARVIESGRYHGAMLDRDAGHFHPLNYALGLAAAAEAAGARLFEGSAAARYEDGAPARVETARGRVRARHVILCCNGYLEGLEPRIAGKIMPIQNYMIATAPLGEARASALIPGNHAVFDTKFVVDYFRLSPDGRLLFGGGETYGNRQPRDIAAFVRKYMLRVFPQLSDIAIDYAWGGQLAITLNRMPHFGRLGKSGYFAQGFSGHGVALTTLAGRVIAEAVAGCAERFDLFAKIRHRAFPGGTLLRKPGLVVGMLYYALKDRL